MKTRLLPAVTILLALLFTLLFYRTGIGMNAAIFYTVFAGVFAWSYGWKDKSAQFKLLFMATLILSWCIAWHGNYFTIFVFILLLVFLAGATALGKVNVALPIFREGIFQVILSQPEFLRSWGNRRNEKGAWKWKYILQYGIPSLIVFFSLLFLYRNSNQAFDRYVEKASVFFSDIFDNLNFKLIFTFILGIVWVNIFLFSAKREGVIAYWSQKIPLMQRMRDKRVRFMKPRGLYAKLRFENRFGVFFIAMLNLLLLLLNISDLNEVWFGFEWTGQLLKEYVHRGTWFLIFSIVISAFTILYFFRGNQNFYSKNKNLKLVVNIWIAQNAFLALSVLVRNLRYIDYYGLAYLRIGVFFFLAAVLMLLFFVFRKIQNRESLWIFIHRNLITFIVLIAACALPDWSMIITRYNLSHYKKSFVHMAFLAKMPDRCLPVMESYRDKLNDIRTEQEKRGFRYSESVSSDEDSDVTFTMLLNRREDNFLYDCKTRDWRENTYADMQACTALQRMKPRKPDHD